MSTKPKEERQFGWGILALLVMFGFFATLIGQFFGVAWFFPWVFLGLFVFLSLRHQKIIKEREEAKRKENAPHLASTDGYEFPHLTSIPGQYTRKPCSTPDWIQIPLYRNYEINCATLDVRHRIFKDIVVPGHDPNGKDDRVWLELLADNDHWKYVPRDWIVEKALGKGHV